MIFLAVMVLTIAAGFEITYLRLKRVIEVRGHHEDALTALSGQVAQQKDRADGLDKRIEGLERHLGFRA